MAKTGTIKQSRILWIDDEVHFLSFMAKRLEERLSVKIDFASTIDTAVQKLASNTYELIITDLCVPYGENTISPYGGLDLVEKIRNGEVETTAGQEELCNIPVLIVTQASHQEVSRFKSKYRGVWIFPKYDLLELRSFEEFLKDKLIRKSGP